MWSRRQQDGRTLDPCTCRWNKAVTLALEFLPPDCYQRKRNKYNLHIVHTTVIRVSIFCKTYILTVIEFDTCTEVASITNPKIQDDQKVQISKSEFQISESGKAISVLFFKQVFTLQPVFRKQFPERCSNRKKCRENSKWWCTTITSHFTKFYKREIQAYSVCK